MKQIIWINSRWLERSLNSRCVFCLFMWSSLVSALASSNFCKFPGTRVMQVVLARLKTIDPLKPRSSIESQASWAAWKQHGPVLQLLENVPTKIFDPRKAEVLRERRRALGLQSEELTEVQRWRNVLYRRLRWAAHVARIGESKFIQNVAETSRKSTSWEDTTVMGG